MRLFHENDDRGATVARPSTGSSAESPGIRLFLKSAILRTYKNFDIKSIKALTSNIIR
jgi:hypothetical protein